MSELDLSALKPNQVALVLIAYIDGRLRERVHFHLLLRNDLNVRARNLATRMEDSALAFKSGSGCYCHRRTSATLNRADDAMYQHVFVYEARSNTDGRVHHHVRNHGRGTPADRMFCDRMAELFLGAFVGNEEAK